MTAESFGQALRRFRLRAGMTITELSEAIGSGRLTITEWERGKRLPRDRARVLDLAQVLRLHDQETAHLMAAVRRVWLAATPEPPPAAPDVALAAAPPPAVLEAVPPQLLPSTLLKTASAAVPPYQISAPPADFIDRTAEIGRIIASFQADTAKGAAALVGIQGMGGVGKTTLALVVANRLGDIFPDGQLILNLRGTSNAPLPVTQALQQVIHSFTPGAQLPEDLEQLRRHYCSILHHKRVLILVDDAAYAAQVQPLTPPVGSALLITSRLRFTLDGLRTILLAPLADAEAVTFLQTVCASLTHSDAQTLARACGCLPLALRIGGSLLHNDPALAVSDYLAQLQDERQRLVLLRDPDEPTHDVAATLALSYAQLDATVQQVFRQLGVFVTDFGAELASAVVTTPDTVDVSKILRHLLRRNLVMYDEEQARWRLHDLVRDLARHYLDAAGETEAVRRRYAYAAVPLAQKLHKQYLAGGAKASAARARFDAERPHLEAAWTWANTHTDAAEGAYILLTTALATTHLGEIRLDPRRERIPLLEGALKAARSLGQLREEGKVLLSLGRATFGVGAIRRAIELWEQARTIFQTLGDMHSSGSVLGNLGMAFARLGEPQRAIAMHGQALGIFQALGDQRREGYTLGNLGAAYADLRDARAIPYLKQALAYARTARDRRFEVMLLRALCEVAAASGRLWRARVLCGRALVIAREIGDRQQEAYTLISQGCLSAALKEQVDAVDAFEQALVILQEIADQWGAAECSWHYSLVLIDQKDYERALPLLRASVAYQTTIDHALAPVRAARLAQLEADADHSAVSLPLGR
ncbi:MAG TPA: helix-turn-helix transcriptional regulator [Roseiflexaceae bacterium]|nr:helix-turn-helix transcriptional regulator [Roseiflexaceae bacterium]